MCEIRGIGTREVFCAWGLGALLGVTCGVLAICSFCRWGYVVLRGRCCVCVIAGVSEADIGCLLMCRRFGSGKFCLASDGLPSLSRVCGKMGLGGGLHGHIFLCSLRWVGSSLAQSHLLVLTASGFGLAVGWRWGGFF